ncbi:FAD-dependent oxidoreductase [Oceanobacillus halophilus]|uniref:FAD-binding protein n=1 Tax=Oceanobacillus halophilus TaxID=930130 RepID=A0A494ZVC0_9BACI|nr:FAD-dependent oxidoreductase [Oceanobacillus halophilus]RKQ30406.1 FAD-binding protein [Oceanobacillus halophilus]
MRFPHVFKEGKIGGLLVKNRVVMPGMGTGLASPEGEVTEQLIRYYEERAKGGTGLLITEFTSIDYELGKGTPNQLRIDDDALIPGIKRLSEAIHKHDAKLFVQLHHAGRESNSALLNGKQIVAPSPVTCAAIGEEPRELTTTEVKNIIQQFIQGAIRCKNAQADGVELHGAHGYLISQFLNPHTNLRKDEFGGSFENRMRFITEIIQGIKQACGDHFTVIVRLSVDEFDQEGLTVEESQEISRYLEKIGVNAIHASAGNYNSIDKVIESPLFEQGWRVYLAEAIKEVVQIPVIAVGNIREPGYVDSIIADGKADFVAMGRTHIADPEWSNKALEGREKEIRMCISCLHCTYSSQFECSINARAGHELEYTDFEKINENRHVVIVGGGPGGMEAARVLSLRGYDVSLFEKTNQLGGQLRLVSDPVYKKKMTWYCEYLAHEMERLNVNIHLQTEATVEKITDLEPYAVILATGSKPYIPEIQGHHHPHVWSYEDIRQERKEFNNLRITVIGSGMICHSTARRFAEQGNHVTWIEQPTRSKRKISPQTRARLMQKLEDKHVNIVTNHEVSKILANSIIIQDKHSQERSEIETDQVVMAMGVEPSNPLESKLKGYIHNLYVIGDAVGYSSLADATHQGFKIAYSL